VADLTGRLRVQGLFPPSLGGGGKHAIDQWLKSITPLRRFSMTSGEQGHPGRLHNPVYDPTWVGLAQRGHGRKRVEDVSHGAQPDDKEAKL
jgi:hypothetical protein